MTFTDDLTWQQRRGDFNHHWLKNRVLQALDSASNVLEGRIQGVSYLDGILNGELLEWPERYTELVDLLMDFKKEMSPRHLFEGPPLSNWESDLKGPVSEFLHMLWLLRCPADDLVNEALKCAAAADECYAHLVMSQPWQREGAVDPKFASHFESFRQACRNLSKVIEKFPNKVVVT